MVDGAHYEASGIFVMESHSVRFYVWHSIPTC